MGVIPLDSGLSQPSARFPPMKSQVYTFALPHQTETLLMPFTQPHCAPAADNGAPGLRTKVQPDYYAAFVIDLDGYRIEALCGHDL